VTVAHVSSAAHVVGTGSRRAADGHVNGSFEKLEVGQRLDMSVLQQLEEQQYLVSMAGGQHVVDSLVPLNVGARVRAVVVSVGDRLELKYLSSDSEPAAAPDETSPTPSLLDTLQARYKVALDTDQHDSLEQAVSRATDPTSMALGGLFLAKSGHPVAEEGLQALYVAQRIDGNAANRSSAAGDVTQLVQSAAEGDDSASAMLAEMLGNAFTDDGGGGDLSRWLLNIQNEGSVAYRYGTLPVMVAGQLVELDLVHFQQRPTASAATQIRRLVMTFDTKTLGPVQVEARALDNRLIITFTGQTTEAATELSAYSGEVRQLAGRLGWNVEGVGYEYGSEGRAARQIIDHVLSAGSVDMEF